MCTEEALLPRGGIGTFVLRRPDAGTWHTGETVKWRLRVYAAHVCPHLWTTGRRACPQAPCKTARAGGEPEWQAVLSPGLCVCGSEFAQRWSWGAVSNGEVLVLRRAPGSRHGCLSSHHINQLGHHPGEEDWSQKHVRQEALLLQACAHLLGRTLGNMWEH